jgi:hypothetical protein
MKIKSVGEQAKEIHIDQKLNEEVFYVGDETFLRHLFFIFLENAVKYSPPKTRSVYV